ncbi:DUF2325 domain-containing protein [Nitrosovibrio sp. Nv17]|uniref:DUF2325 domain-containing protein n=1 Tax=Nitrosovibrio sp. Nv17 TaxID=1855339 RepID=UPI0009089A5A|nr:DUF2325 domain-containing protein [Nitrosovibrio sp. Nv17]SFW10851.1 hypothetical protein SAMN05216414_101140 [Nitrosovibrio sp. Nv17]
MTALIVGGDYIETFRRELIAHGLKDVEHWNGRQSRFAKRTIPTSAKLVVILYDYVNHSVSNALKLQANKNGIPLLFCRSSTHELRRKLGELALAEPPCRGGDPLPFIASLAAALNPPIHPRHPHA